MGALPFVRERGNASERAAGFCMRFSTIVKKKWEYSCNGSHNAYNQVTPLVVVPIKVSAAVPPRGRGGFSADDANHSDVGET